MLTKRILSICLLAFFFTRPYAQVNLQTGSAVFSLPVFNWQDDKSRLNSVVALSYNSGNGLRVNDVASNVGQGWNLIAGGVITRMQVGEPDDQVARNGTGVSDLTKYPPGILYASTPASEGCPTALHKYPIYRNMNQMYTQHNAVAEDRQLDYFSFQFNGKAGMFVLDPGNLGVCHSLGDSKMKITFEQDANLIISGIRTKITSFSIQDVDGLIYKFSIHGLTKILKSDYFDANLSHSLTQPQFLTGKVYNMTSFDNGEIENPYVIGSWYLSEIKDPLTNRTVLFSYENRDINSKAGIDISYNEEKNYALLFHKVSVAKVPDITTISYPDGHIISFNYGDDRVDLLGAKVLSSVNVTYQGRYLSQHQFNTSYFILNRYGTPTTPFQKSVARLCLRSVRKIGVDLKEDSPPYIFDYYTGSSTADDVVPPPFTYAKDVWGFYNGNYSVAFNNAAIPLHSDPVQFTVNQLKGLCYRNTGVSGVYLNPKPDYARNGLLKQIIYPTGGTLIYEYEQNAGTPVGGTSDITIGGVHVSQTKSTDGGQTHGCNNPLITDYDYVLSNGNSSLWGIEMPDNSMVTDSHYEPDSRYFYWKPSCIFGCCDWRFKYPGIVSQQQAINLTQFQNLMITAAPYLGVLSLASTIYDIATLIGSASPGFGTIAAVVLDIISGIVSLAVTCVGNQDRDYTSTVYYNSDLNGIAPLPTQFKRVEVVENPGTIGKTIQEFTDSDDYPLWHGTNPTFSAKQRFAPWAYGLPKKTIVKDANNTIRETVNTYNFDIEYGAHCPNNEGPHYDRSLLLKTTIDISSCKCLVTRTTSQRNDHWSDPAVYADPDSYYTTSDENISVDIYKMYTGRAELIKTQEKVYKPNSSEFLETITEYVYNDENYEVQLVKTTKSDGAIIQKNIYYTIDYVIVHGDCYLVEQTGTTDPAINTLVQNNIIGLPVETNTLFTEPGSSSNGKYISDKATIFAVLENGDIKPSAILEGRFSQPTDKVPFWEHDYSNFSYYFPQPLFNPVSPDYSFYKTTQIFSYDVAGKLIGVKDEGNRQVCSIYDYDDKYVAATIINADLVVDKPAYSSFETASFGGWTFNGGAASYNTSSSITGARSLNLGGNTLSADLNSDKAYTISFWATNGNITVSGSATLLKSAPTIGGFTYYEYELAAGATSITVSGNSTMDELRLYPKSARMSSTTYDPLIGKTSEADGNNRITYYEYDNLGRLRFIKDDNKNILKMYEYNNVSAAKQNGCPGTYSNQLISEVFVKSDCGTGYIGGSVTYTVAANTFTSAISQADADAQAENYLLVNGPAYANSNGACIQLFYNQQQSENFITETCPIGYEGGIVSYVVPANHYVSTVSLAEANQMALDDIAANGQAYANGAGASCTTTSDPLWEWLENAPWYCLSVNGNLPPHLFIFETDINPNSSTYLQTRWSDVGPSDLCPAGNYYNSQQSAQFTRNNCASGYTGSTVTYTVPPGTFSSTVSQAAANQLALDDISANGQAYANTNGTCTPNCTSYRITVPDGVATNLYIQYTPCGSSTPVWKNWNTEILLDYSDPGYSKATICMSTGSSIAFKYGSNGTPTPVPEITITTLDPCP